MSKMTRHNFGDLIARTAAQEVAWDFFWVVRPSSRRTSEMAEETEGRGSRPVSKHVDRQ